MADTATAEPQTDPDTGEAVGSDTTETAPQTTTSQTPQRAARTSAESGSRSRGRTAAVPVIVHGTNAAGAVTGTAYAVAGVPGLAAAAATSAAVGAAALYSRARRSSTATARRAVREAARAARQASSSTGSRSGFGGGRGGLFGGGRSGSRSGNRSGGTGTSGSTGGGRGRRGTGTGGGSGSSGTSGSTGAGRRGGGRHAGGTGGAGTGRTPGTRSPNSPGANTPRTPGGKNNNGPGNHKGGRAWQTLKGAANRLRSKGSTNRGGSGSGGNGSGKNSPGKNNGAGKNGTPGAAKTPRTAKTRAGRAVQKARKALRNRMGKLRGRLLAKLRRNKKGAAAAGKAGATSGRVYRLRRIVMRKLAHWGRMAGAGLLATFFGLLTLPLGVLWGLARTVSRHRDPLYAWAFPVRIAGRVWRQFYRRSKAKHDKEAAADRLTMTVNDPRKDTPMTGSSLASGTSVLDGNNSKFALSMRAAYAAYTGYSPGSMMEVAAEYGGLPNAMRATGMAVQQMTLNSDQQFPCSKRAVAKLTECYMRLMSAGARADAMVELFREAHAFDIERIISPRTNEWMWNVTPTGSSAPEGAMFMPGRIESGCVLMAVLYRGFAPVHMLQVGSEFLGMAMGLNSLADAIQVLHQRTRDLYPVDDRVTDELGTIVGMIRAAADDAAMAAKLFEADHALEISHNLNPRKGPAAEGMWNTSR